MLFDSGILVWQVGTPTKDLVYPPGDFREKRPLVNSHGGDCNRHAALCIPTPTPESTATPFPLHNSRVSATERVQRALDALGLPGPVRVFDAGSTHTAQEAADAVGCALGQIVKTLFFVAEGRPTMVLAAGDRQVDTAMLAPILGVGRKKLKMGTPSEVLEYTGFPVGGVAPVGWPKPVDVVVDDSLRRFEEVWAAAGASNAVFMARTDDLVRAIHGQWGCVVRSPE